MELDTIFRIYSMTKPITSVALMMLFEHGLVRLTDPVTKFIPEFKKVKVFVSKDELADLEREITILTNRSSNARALTLTSLTT
jgi:CubicO group peptidase (beta-lactamase class C family)